MRKVTILLPKSPYSAAASGFTLGEGKKEGKFNENNSHSDYIRASRFGSDLI